MRDNRSGNPFEDISLRLAAIEAKLDTITGGTQAKPEFMNIDQASEFLNLKKSAIYRRTMEGTVPFFKSGRKLMFKRSDLIQFIENSQYTGIKSTGIEIEK